MALLVAILLALLVLPSPWGWVFVGAAAVYEAVSTWLGWRWSRRRPSVVGLAALVGSPARVVDACGPDGWVEVRGERWRARCADGANVGELVHVVAVDGLTLVVERGSRADLSRGRCRTGSRAPR